MTKENALEILKQTCNPNEDNYRDVKENAVGFTAQNLARKCFLSLQFMHITDRLSYHTEINLKELREINVNQAHYIACELLTAYQNIKKVLLLHFAF